MKQVLMMVQDTCPHCRRAFEIMEELQAENPEFAGVLVDIQDERKNKALADTLDYWYVPTCFVGGKKIHEGVPSREKLKLVFEEALKD